MKRYEQETNLRAYLVVDASGSMGYRSHPDRMTKLETASALAATLAYLLFRQQDAAGLVLVQGQVAGRVPPRAAAEPPRPDRRGARGGAPRRARPGSPRRWTGSSSTRRAAPRW